MYLQISYILFDLIILGGGVHLGGTLKFVGAIIFSQNILINLDENLLQYWKRSSLILTTV